MPSRARVRALLCLLLLVTATPARADDARERSRAAFMRGVAETHQGHYTAARDAFFEAYTLFAHPSILLNLGIARWHTGEYVRAEADLTRFLSDDGGATSDEIASARAALLAVRQHLGVVRMRIMPDGARATLDGQPVALVPGAYADVRAVVGPAVLRVEAEGYQPAQRTLMVAHDPPVSVDLSLLRVGQEVPPGDASASAGSAAAPATGTPTRKLVAYGALGYAGLAVVVGAACGLRAIVLANAYNTPGSTGFQDPGTKSTGIAFRTSADVLFGTALVAAGVGAYLLVFPLGRSSSAPAAPTSSLRLGPGAFAFQHAF